MKKPRKPQSIIPTDDDRVVFKKKCKAALKDIEAEYGISFKFGRIDEPYSNRARMRVWFEKVEPKNQSLFTTPAATDLLKQILSDRNDGTNLWDSPAAIALTDALKAAQSKQS